MLQFNKNFQLLSQEFSVFFSSWQIKSNHFSSLLKTKNLNHYNWGFKMSRFWIKFRI